MCDRKVITMRRFLESGRGANQMFRYAFLNGYARRHAAELQMPAWFGNHVFGALLNPITESLPVWNEPGRGLIQPTPPTEDELVNRDFWGCAQYQTSYFADDQDRIRKLFEPVESVEERLRLPEWNLRQSGKTIIGIHLRRGDYGRRIFPIIPTSWYLQWLGENWERFDNPSLFIASEDPTLYNDFAKYHPHVTATLGIHLSDKPMADCVYLPHDLETKDRRALDWYPDFYLLSQCDVILGPSSTFSFFAAMLSQDLREYYRGSLAEKTRAPASSGFVPTDPWDDYPLLREHCRDYPHIEGITSDPSNPYW